MNGEPYKVAYEDVSDRWQIAVTVSERGFQQVSFANSIATTKVSRLYHKREGWAPELFLGW